MESRRCDDHGFGFAVQLVADRCLKVLHDDGYFFGDCPFMPADELLEQRLGLHLLELRIVFYLFQQRPVLVEGRVVFQHIEDEALFDCLTHGVEAEGPVSPICLFGAEQLQGLGLWGGGEGEVAHILLWPASLHFLLNSILVCLFFLILLLIVRGIPQNFLNCLGAVAGDVPISLT
jgi:hypothetical protein